MPEMKSSEDDLGWNSESKTKKNNTIEAEEFEDDESEGKEDEEEDDLTPFERLPEKDQQRIKELEKKFAEVDDFVTVVVFDQSPQTLEEKILGKERKRVPKNVKFHLKTTTVGDLKKQVLEVFGKEVNDRNLGKIKLVKNGQFMHPDTVLVKQFLTLEIDKKFCNMRKFGWRNPYAGSVWLVPNHIEPSNLNFDKRKKVKKKGEEKVEVKRTLKAAVRKYQLGTLLLRNPMAWKKEDGREKLDPI
eukprot:g3678.t1